jgi:hypothetical protein
MIFRGSIFLFIILFCFSSYGTVSQIHSVTRDFIRFTNGEVGFIQSLPKFADLSAGSWVSYETDFSQEIVSLSPIDKESLDLSSPVDSWTLPFEPSDEDSSLIQAGRDERVAVLRSGSYLGP